MTDTTHTPGPWSVHEYTEAIMGQRVFVAGPDKSPCKSMIANLGPEMHTYGLDIQRANAKLIAAAPDRHDQIVALVLMDWTVEKRSLYDEEGVEGWAWIEPNGTEHVEIGDWNELPPWPDSARAAIAKATKP